MNQEIWLLFCHKTLDTGYVCQVHFHEIFSGSVMNGNEVGSTGVIIRVAHLENAVPMTLPAVPRKRENTALPRSPEAPVMTIVLLSMIIL